MAPTMKSRRGPKIAAVAALAAALALAVTLATGAISLGGSGSGGVTAADPTGGAHVTLPPAATRSTLLTWGRSVWTSNGRGGGAKGYVVDSPAEIKKLPAPVAADVNTALATEWSYVALAWHTAMLAGAGKPHHAPPLPPAATEAGKWVAADAMAAAAQTFGGPGAGCAGYKNPHGTELHARFDYDLRDLLCDAKYPTTSGGWWDNSWNAFTFARTSAYVGPSASHRTLPVIVDASSPAKATGIWVPFGVRGDYRFVTSPGPEQLGPTRYGAIEVEGWSELLATRSAGGWRIVAPLVWLVPSGMGRTTSGGATHYWYYATTCAAAPEVLPGWPAALSLPFRPQAVARSVTFCGPGQKLG